MDKKWVTYRYADKSALNRKYADPYIGGGGIVRMARCRLPATSRVVKEIKSQLAQFDKSSWVYKNKIEPEENSDSTTPSPVESGWEYVCTAVVDHFICDRPNVTDPYNDDGCTYTGSECVEWTLMYFDDGGGGGIGGGGGSDGSDPCEPCTSDGTTLCEDDPTGTPEGCQVDTDFEIALADDPCEQADILEDDSEFRNKMSSLMSNAKNLDYETGYLIRRDNNNGGYNYEFQQGEPNDPFMDYTVNSKIDGNIHSHFSGNWSNFTGQDIRFIFQSFNAGLINNLETFTAGVVSPYGQNGTSHLLKIEDIQKFLNFAQSHLENDSDFNSFADLYDLKRDQFIIAFGEVKGNQIALLDLLDDFDSGLMLFQGNGDFTEWQAIENNSGNTDVVNSSCN